MFNCQLNLGLDLDLDIEAQQNNKDNGRQKLYKLKVPKTFAYIIFEIYLLQLAKVILFWLFFIIYCVSILIIQYYKIIISKGCFNN